MDEVIASLDEQFPLFADYVEQFPDLVGSVESDLFAVVAVVSFLSTPFLLSFDALILARDAAYRLIGLADQGGFRDVSKYFYWVYELVSKQMASFVSQ